MTQFLPPNLLALFQARPPIPYVPPPDLNKKKQPPYQGLSSYLHVFEDPSETPPPQPPQPDTKETRRKRKRDDKDNLNKQRIADQITQWDPQDNSEATGDAYKTLFVGRISYETSERRLKREFEEYGPVRKVQLVKDKEGKPRGYAFIEFEDEKDMRSAYKLADGRKVDGRRVLVDVERGRTVKGWRPRRLGGGLGSSRAPRPPGTKPHEPSKTEYAVSDSYRRPSEGGGGGGGGGGGDYRRRDTGDHDRSRDRGDRDGGGHRRDSYRSGDSYDRDRGGDRGGDRYSSGGYDRNRGGDRRDSYRSGDRDHDKDRYRR